MSNEKRKTEAKDMPIIKGLMGVNSKAVIPAPHTDTGKGFFPERSGV
jgi:hypothetical protein